MQAAGLRFSHVNSQGFCQLRAAAGCSVLGLFGKGLVAGDYRGGFCEKLPEASPVSDRANATGSRTDPPLGTAEPITDGGITSGITCLRKGKSCCATRQLWPKGEVRI